MWLAQMGTNTVGNLREESIVIARNGTPDIRILTGVSINAKLKYVRHLFF